MWVIASVNNLKYFALTCHPKDGFQEVITKDTLTRTYPSISNKTSFTSTLITSYSVGAVTIHTATMGPIRAFINVLKIVYLLMYYIHYIHY